MRKILLAKNTVASLLAQVTALICGFILPRLFLQHFGSEVNGLVNSITQFLSVISFLELGVGAVVESALYKPLADRDTQQVSRVMVSANKFFRRLAQILLVYVIGLMLVYPYIANQDFGYVYTATLIAAISISSFAQYYFGIVNALLLNADQRGYIQYNAQTITLILNTVVCAIMISVGGSVQLVKLTTSLIYLARPLVLRIYVNRKYQIDWKIKYTEEPIQQKWNGVAQHVAAVVLDGTDTIVLTLFSTLSNVSIYSVYNMVIRGVMNLFNGLFGGIQALLGELYAREENDQLKSTFEELEWVTHLGTVWVFGCVVTLIVPFVQVYTSGILDAEYVQPLFAAVIVLATAVRCVRIPYNVMILAAGHYRQTQSYYVLTALVNLVTSVILVKPFGLIGVAIGTLMAMTFHLVWGLTYVSKKLVTISMKNEIKLFVVDVCMVILGVLATGFIEMRRTTYYSWILLAVQKAAIWTVAVIVIELVFYRRKISAAIKRILGARSK